MKKDLNYNLINKILIIAIIISTYMFMGYTGILKTIVSLFWALTPFYLGVFLAWLMLPLGRIISKKTNLSIKTSNVLAVAVNLIVVIMFLLTVVPLIVWQVSMFYSDINVIIANASDSLMSLIEYLNLDSTILDEWLNQLTNGGVLDGVLKIVTNSVGTIFKVLTSTFGVVLQIIFSYIIAFYFVNDVNNFIKKIIKLFSGKKYEKNISIAREMSDVLFSYTKGMVLVSIFIFTADTIGAYALGIPLPFLLGLIAGIFNVVPYLGPVLGGIPIVLFGFSVDVKTGLLAFILAVVVQSIESIFLQPKILGKKTNLKPTSVLVGVLIFSSIFGLVGFVIATPAMAMIRILLKHSKYDIRL